MKKVITILIVCMSIMTISLYSQIKELPSSTLQKIDKYFNEDGEIYFKFTIFSKNDIETITRIISIDNVKGNDVYAFANKEEFGKFRKLGYNIELLKLPYETATGITSSDDLKAIQAWDVYPTYTGYVSLMNNFASNYPTLCRIVDAGTTPGGRKILFAVISKNVSTAEAEPKFMYTSSMHGDETTGYVLMLRLIDTLLSGYSTNPKFSYLLDNIEIWINPLANPDGTYRTGNTILFPRRGNNNNVDLNRNFPDPIAGQHPDGYAWQTETNIFMNVATTNYFTLSCNFHGGAEVVNYPWDSKAAFSADDNWWRYLSRQYVDTVHKYSPSTYLDDLLSNIPNIRGITNGYAWYVVYGGRQDYMTYFKRGRECTIEISATKLLPASQLPAHWNYNFRSLINYMMQALYGLTGIVSDSLSGEPLRAKIILNIDVDSSEVYSSITNGKYNRMLYAGNYTVTATNPNYHTKTISNVVINNNATTVLNIQLVPTALPVNLHSFTANVNTRNVRLNWTTTSETNNSGFNIERMNVITNIWDKIGYEQGKGTVSTQTNYSFEDRKLQTGKYRYRLKQIDVNGNFEYFELNGEVEIGVPTRFNLSQNYPNPFNPTTKIDFDLPYDSKVNIIIYDISGREVKTVVNDSRTAGYHTVQFNAADLSSGVYFYRILTKSVGGEYVMTKKMALIK